MRLKKMMIIGFKSFADKTVLQFDDGVTCIVGPNGCGKSNIADAFRWVLGEQSAKSLRGQKMNDVIFAGTTKRKPLNMAEVSLTFVDIKGKLPVDYEEVTISRRLHRSGESDYLLNGRSVRLKDIQSLFLDSGMGCQAFSIFEQGKIDQVINYSPIERRSIFEEAAGIVRFLERKRESLRRLEHTENNLERVMDVSQEVEKQIVVLKQQAEKAVVFKSNQSLLESLEKSHCVARWDQLELKSKDVSSRQHKCQNMLIELNQELNTLKISEQEYKNILNSSEKQRHFQNGELFRIRGQKALADREWKSDQERLQEAQKKEKKFTQELEEIRRLDQGSKATELNLKQQVQALQEKLKNTETEMKSHQAILKRKEEGMNKLRTELQSSLQQRLKLNQKESQLDSEYKQNGVRLENNQDRKNALVGKREILEKDLEQFNVQQQQKKKQLGEITASVETYQSRFNLCENELQKIGLEIDKKQKERETVQKRSLEYKARQKILIKMREDQEGFSLGSKKLLQESHRDQSPLFQKIQPLYEFFKADAELAESLAIILRSYSQTLVVQTFADFDLIVEFAKKQKLQDFSLLCVEGIKEVDGVSHEKNGLQKITTNLVASHFLSRIAEVQYDQEAIKLLPTSSGNGIWSREGLFFDRYHVAFFQKPNESHVFLREAELLSLTGEISIVEDKYKVIEQEVMVLQKRKTAIQEERAELDKLLRREEMKKAEINFSLQRSLSDQDRVEKEIVLRQKEMETLAEQIMTLQELLAKIQQNHRTANQDLKRCQEEVERFEKEIEDQNGVLRIEQKDQKEKETAYRLLTEEHQRLIHQLNLLEMKQQERKKQEQRIEGECAQLKMIHFTINDKSAVAQDTMHKLQIALEELEKSHALLEIEVTEQKAALEKIEASLTQKRNLCKKSEDENHQLVLQLAQISSTAESLAMQLNERYQLSIEDARGQVGLQKNSIENVEKQIRGLRQALQEAGDVNMTSIEELEQHQERSIDLHQQMNDIVSSKNELLKIIGQLDGDSCKIFKETFELIRENFKKNFAILFQGGVADLQFTETNHVLEAGIEITAQPPGKQMKTINLLSGGEKCLTAVALLFAIFEVKPSPFCILDEIDAPLDESNVERFVKMVRHFVDRCQFLIITHNKRTMATGDVLCGVSMEEKGVSKLLSLNLGSQDTESCKMEGELLTIES